jgi:hypothetical protein
VKKVWKAISVYRSIDFQNVGVIPLRSIPFAPDASRVASNILGLSRTAIRQRGIVAD